LPKKKSFLGKFLKSFSLKGIGSSQKKGNWKPLPLGKGNLEIGVFLGKKGKEIAKEITLNSWEIFG